MRSKLWLRSGSSSGVGVLGAGLCLAAIAVAEGSRGSERSAEAGSYRVTAKPLGPERLHPLRPWAEYAAARYRAVRRELRDYVCLLIKRERIEGRLSEHQYLRTKVRLGQDEPPTPLSVLVEYLGPEELRGRRALYVAGWNDGKMRVRVGGRRFPYLKVNVELDSDAARLQSNYPLTDMALDTIIRRLWEQAQRDMAADPQGRNTAVLFFRNAAVDGRPCRRVRVVHPRPAPGLVFHIADVYIDQQLELPLRVEGYGWPEDGGEPPLLEEFTFSRLQVNVGLTDADFDPAVLDGQLQLTRR